MTLREEQTAFSKDIHKLQGYLLDNSYEWTDGECYRTQKQQEWYVEQGLSKTLKSMHLKRLARDINIFKDGSYLLSKDTLQHIGDYWESLDPKNRWGGNWISFQDCPHFERYVP